MKNTVEQNKNQSNRKNVLKILSSNNPLPTVFSMSTDYSKLNMMTLAKNRPNIDKIVYDLHEDSMSYCEGLFESFSNEYSNFLNISRYFL